MDLSTLKWHTQITLLGFLINSSTTFYFSQLIPFFWGSCRRVPHITFCVIHQQYLVNLPTDGPFFKLIT